MEVQIFKDYQDLSAQVADEITGLVKRKPDAVICLASGTTPLLPCRLTVEKAIKDGVDFSRCTFIGLDEWVGVSPGNEGSCHWFFHNHLLKPLKIPASQTHLFDGIAKDLDKECRIMDDSIAASGGIDLIVVGIGMNGHIGFNEPGVSFDTLSHVIDLDTTTLSVGQKYFSEPVQLQKGITLGLKHLMEARKALLIANGIKKAEVIKKTVEGVVEASFPASIMQKHPHGFVMLDTEAASLLSIKTARV